MKTKLKDKMKSVPTLHYAILFLLSYHVTSIHSYGLPRISRVRDLKGGQTLASRTETKDGDVEVSLRFKKNGKTITSLGQTTRLEANKMNECELSKETLALISKPDASTWIVHDYVVEMLNNNLQQLISCTKPHDKIIFITLGTIKIAETLQIVHDLEFIAVKEVPMRTVALLFAYPGVPKITIACPKSGPALSVNGSSFKATGLYIVGCSSASGHGAIVIGPGSNVTFNFLYVKDNQNTGLFIWENSNVTLYEAHFERNQASGNGGAIHANGDSSISIEQSYFIGNIASEGCGGAIYGGNRVNILMRGPFIQDNVALKGGGLCLTMHSTLHIIYSVFRNNTAAEYGGAIVSLWNNNIIVDGTSFTKNVARFGGAMHLLNSNNATILATRILDNNADYGGGLDTLYHNNVTIIMSTISYNNAIRGGGIYVWDYNNFTLIESTISRNTAFHGGGIYFLYHNKAIISSSEISKNNGRDGGGIYLWESNKATILNSKILKNVAKDHNGGGIYLDHSNDAKIVQTQISSNTAHVGGGIFSSGSNFIFIRSIILNNTARYGIGGGAYLGGSNFIFIRSIILNNTASSGGGVHLAGSRNVTMFRSIISNNTARFAGGAIYISYANTVVTILQSIISNNTAEYGGGIYLHKLNNATIIHSQISNNTAEEGGGLNLFTSNNATIIQSQISNNTAQYGGGIYCRTENFVSIINSRLTNNSGSYSGKYVGLYFYKLDNFLIVKNSTISNQGTNLDGLVKFNPVEDTKIMKFPISRSKMKIY